MGFPWYLRCTSNAVNVNLQIARRLEELAGILDAQGANRYRVDAYRRAATTLRYLPEPLPVLWEREGLKGLLKLPAIGDRLAVTIRDLLLTGRLPLLEHLRGEVNAEALLRTVPGIGHGTAYRLHHDLGIDTLEDLEAAAHDGRLATLAGFGAKRIAGIMDSLASRLGRIRQSTFPPNEDIPVAELLDVDREYRELAASDVLQKVAPRRFNPSGDAWLPILHTERGERDYTALYSNTARAHALGRTRDWVILYEDTHKPNRQYTVVTEQSGPLRGRRVVRGHEPECRSHYDGAPTGDRASPPERALAPVSR